MFQCSDKRYKDMRMRMKISAKSKPKEGYERPIPIDELERFTEPNIFATNQQQGQPVSPPSTPTIITWSRSGYDD